MMPVEAVAVTYELEASEKASAERLAIQINKTLQKGTYVGHLAVNVTPGAVHPDTTGGVVFLIDVPETETSTLEQ